MPLVTVGGRLCSMTSPSEAPWPAMVPVIRPGWYVIVVPVYEICMELPLVTASRRRRKEISLGERPGFVGDELRILEMWTGRPVSVDRVSRCVNERCPVNRRNSGVESAMLSVVSVVPENLFG